MIVPWGDIFIQIAWWFMTICAVGGAIGVVASNSLFHSALFLILSLFGVAGYYVLLSAGFLAVVQLLIYVGAIAILILFAIMFSRQVMKPKGDSTNRQWFVSAVVAAVFFSVLMVLVNSLVWPTGQAAPTGDSIVQLGVAFLGSYLIPFLVVGVLLSVALIGAIFLAREKVNVEEAN